MDGFWLEGAKITASKISNVRKWASKQKVEQEIFFDGEYSGKIRTPTWKSVTVTRKFRLLFDETKMKEIRKSVGGYKTNITPAIKELNWELEAGEEK